MLYNMGGTCKIICVSKDNINYVSLLGVLVVIKFIVTVIWAPLPGTAVKYNCILLGVHISRNTSIYAT